MISTKTLYEDPPQMIQHWGRERRSTLFVRNCILIATDTARSAHLPLESRTGVAAVAQPGAAGIVNRRSKAG